MNLKEAARTIGVHYQTAYKWVRSGELAAVRIGSRYEVSQAAIDQFLANRRTLIDQADPVLDERRRITDVHPEDLLEELEVMLHDPIVTIPAIEGFVARRAAHVLGDTVLVAVDSADGAYRHALIDHPRADRAAFYNAIIGLSGSALMEQRGFLGGAMVRGESVLMPIVDQVALRRSLKSELRQYLDVYPIHSLVGAPVLADGELRGVLVFTRDRAGHPYTSEDERFVRRVTNRLGPLVQTADDITAAWELRRTLVDVIQRALTRRAPGRRFTSDEIGPLLFGPGAPGGDSRLPCVVMGADETVLAVNRAFEDHYGIPAATIVGRHRRESVPQDEWEHSVENYDRLTRGEIDYDDREASRLGPHGEAHPLVLHRAAVREPDATLACVITVSRQLYPVPVDADLAAPVG